MRSRRDTKHGPARYKPTDTRQNHRKTHTNMLTSLNNPYNLFVNIVFQNNRSCRCVTHRMRSLRTGPCVQTLIKSRVFLNFRYLQVQSELLSRFSTVRGLFSPLSLYPSLTFYCRKPTRPTDVNGGPVSASQAKQTRSGSVLTADGAHE